MGDQKWENLPIDCLVDILSRVGVMLLLKVVPLVCKSWYKATLSPQCWQSLFFPPMCCYTKSFVKFVIGRSQGSAYSVTFSSYFPMTKEIFNCIVEGCPSLKRLELPQIISVFFRESYARAISTLLPNIELLSLGGLSVTRSEVVNILKGCKKLVHFDSGSWRGFDVDDEIMNLAAHITTFKFEVSKTECSNGFDYGYYNFDFPDYRWDVDYGWDVDFYDDYDCDVDFE